MKNLGPFLIVGATAAGVHQTVVMAIVEIGLMRPAPANIFGFCTAWLVSYFGHRKFTFRSTRAHREAAPRFLLVSLLAFAANQAIFVTLLQYTALHYAVALFLTLVAVASGTYVLSSRWAFTSTRS